MMAHEPRDETVFEFMIELADKGAARSSGNLQKKVALIKQKTLRLMFKNKDLKRYRKKILACEL